MPEISVVMPVYNGEEFLPEAIESILEQTFGDFEFIIVCEYGSSDESLKIVERYAEQDRRIRPIHNDAKLGISASLNVGLRAATGKYIARMDGDDLSGKRRFEVQKLFLDNYPEIGVVGTTHTVNNSPNWLVDYVSDPDLLKSQLLFFVPMRHPTIMFRKKFVETCSYDETLAGVEDYDFYYKLSKVTKLSNIVEPSLFLYRQTTQNASVVHVSRDRVLLQMTQRKILDEQLQLQFSDSQMEVLHLLGDNAYRKKTLSKYPGVFLELEKLLEQIETRNLELGVYKQDCLLQTLSHRWYREKYKLDILLDKKIPKDVLEIWRGSKYYRQWF